MSAHDLENTSVLLAFERDGSFVLDVANDPSWLKLRLERFPGASRTGWCCGSTATSTAGVGRVHPGPHRRDPSSARTRADRTHGPCVEHYGLVIDPYPLAIRRADGRVVVEEIAGDAWSGVIDLTGQFHAPLLDPTIVGIVLIGVSGDSCRTALEISYSAPRTKDTESNTKESHRLRGSRVRCRIGSAAR